MTDIEQQRRTVRALELLGESRAAYDRGDTDYRDLAGRAHAECGSDTVSFILGGIAIGEIPEPGTENWPRFLSGQQDALAENEHAAAGEDTADA